MRWIGPIGTPEPHTGLDLHPAFGLNVADASVLIGKSLVFHRLFTPIYPIQKAPFYLGKD